MIAICFSFWIYKIFRGAPMKIEIFSPIIFFNILDFLGLAFEDGGCCYDPQSTIGLDEPTNFHLNEKNAINDFFFWKRCIFLRFLRPG